MLVSNKSHSLFLDTQKYLKYEKIVNFQKYAILRVRTLSIFFFIFTKFVAILIKTILPFLEIDKKIKEQKYLTHASIYYYHTVNIH